MIEQYKNKIFNLLLISFAIVLIIQFIVILLFSRKFINDKINYKASEIFPVLIASSNTDLLLKEDFASLRVNIENIVDSFSDQEGIAFIAVIDLYREVTAAFNNELHSDDRAVIFSRLRTMAEDFRFRREYYLNRTKDSIIEISLPLSIEDDNFGTIKVGFLKSTLNRDLVLITRFIILRTIMIFIIAAVIVIIINHKIGNVFDEGFTTIKKDLSVQIREKILLELKKKEDETQTTAFTQIPAQKMLVIINVIDKILLINNKNDILEELLAMIIKIYQAREGALYFLINDSKELMTVAHFDKTGINTNQEDLNHLTIPVGEGDTGKSVQLNLTVISEKPVPGYIISIPVTSANKVIGTIRLTGKSDGTSFGSSDRVLSKIISSLIGNILITKFNI